MKSTKSKTTDQSLKFKSKSGLKSLCEIGPRYWMIILRSLLGREACFIRRITIAFWNASGKEPLLREGTVYHLGHGWQKDIKTILKEEYGYWGQKDGHDVVEISVIIL